MAPLHTRSGIPMRSRVPVLLQMEDGECGIVALAMILAYYGRFVSVDNLREICRVSAGGTTAEHLLSGARHYGLFARAYSLDAGAAAAFPVPVVVHWNSSHFVVVEHCDGERVCLVDPVFGQRIVPYREFGAGFTGTVLVFFPGQDFATGGTRPRFVSRLAAGLLIAKRRAALRMKSAFPVFRQMQ